MSEKKLPTWTVGQEITVFAYGEPIKLTTVASVTRKGDVVRVVDLITSFDCHGKAPGAMRITPTTDEHRAAFERKMLDRRLDELLGTRLGFDDRTARRRAIPTDTVRQVLALLEAAAHAGEARAGTSAAGGPA